MQPGASLRRAVLSILFSAAQLSLAAIPAGAGENRWTPFGPEGSGGGLQILAADPHTSGTVYAVAGVGDLVKSTDGGATWVWSARGLDGSYVQILVIDPRQPATLYAITEIAGYRSDDGAAHWAPIFTAGEDQAAVAAAGPGVVFTVDRSGLNGSVDRGASWTRLYSGRVSQVVASPADGKRVYILVSGDILQSDDGGQSWSPTGPVTHGQPFAPAGTRFLALAPGAPSALYAVSSSGLYSSSNGGAGWSQVASSIPLFVVVVVDPSSPSHLFGVTGFPFSGEALVSGDGGATWTAVAQGVPPVISGVDSSTDLLGLAADAADHTAYSGSEHDGAIRLAGDAGNYLPGKPTGLPVGRVDFMKFSPFDPATIYLGSDRGIYRSTDRGLSWTALDLAVDQAPTASDLEFDPASPGTLFAAGGPGYGGVLRSDDGGKSWSELGSGASFPFALLRRGNGLLAGGDGIFRTVDGGKTWAEVLAAVDPNDPTHSGRFVRRLIADPVDGRVAYALGFEQVPGPGATTALLYKTRNGGLSWQRLSTGITAFAVDPSRTSTLYAATGGGTLLQSTNGGRTWRPLATLPAAVLDLQIDKATPATLYAATDGAGVLRSTDRGRTWAPVNAGLAVRKRTSIATLILDPAMPHQLYAVPFSVGDQKGEPGLFVADLTAP